MWHWLAGPFRIAGILNTLIWSIPEPPIFQSGTIHTIHSHSAVMDEMADALENLTI
jgi:hypothetical protein